MGHLAQSFSSPYAGKLKVQLRGTFYQGNYRDAGFPTSASPGNILVRGYIGPVGSYAYTEPIDRYAPSATVEVDYPGGGVSWNYGTVEVAHQNPTSGIWSYGMGKLGMTVTLTKK